MGRRRRYSPFDTFDPDFGGSEFGGEESYPIKRYADTAPYRPSYEEEILADTQGVQGPKTVMDMLGEFWSSEPTDYTKEVDWYRPFAAREEMDQIYANRHEQSMATQDAQAIKASEPERRAVDPGTERYHEETAGSWAPKITRKPLSDMAGMGFEGMPAEDTELSFVLNVPGAGKPRVVGEKEKQRWEKRPEESWLDYRRRVEYMSGRPGMTELRTKVIRTDPTKYGDVVAEWQPWESKWRPGDRPGHFRKTEEEAAGVPVSQMTVDELKARNMQRIADSPSFLEDPLDWTGRTIIGAMMASPMATGKFLAHMSDAYGWEFGSQVAKDAQSLLPAEGGSLPIFGNLARQIPDIANAIATAIPAGQITKDVRMDWGSVVDYAIERANIRGEEYRTLAAPAKDMEIVDIGLPEELEGVGAFEYINRAYLGIGDPMSQSTKDASKFNPITAAFSDKFWENTSHEFMGLLSLVPMTFSAVGYLGGRDPLQQKLGEVGKFGADISAHVGAHLGELTPILQSRYGDYVEQGLISAIADPLIVLGPLKSLTAGKVAATLDRAAASRAVALGDDLSAAHGEYVVKNISRLETELEAIKIQLDASAMWSEASTALEGLPKWAADEILKHAKSEATGSTRATETRGKPSGYRGFGEKNPVPAMTPDEIKAALDAREPLSPAAPIEA